MQKNSKIFILEILKKNVILKVVFACKDFDTKSRMK